VIGPEQGFTQPGMTVVCGDSHTATHGAFGALAFGIGTSEVEHVLATQTLITTRSKNMRITVEGDLGFGVTAKDLVLAVIGAIGTAGGTGHVIEYAGSAIRQLSMEGRMTVSNMSIEAGARAGLIAPDETTFAYLKGRPQAPPPEAWEQAVGEWRTLPSDAGARYDHEVSLEAATIEPQVTWGTSPQDVVPIGARVPDPGDAVDNERRAAMARSLAYMGLSPGTPMTDVRIDKVFIGSCTNSRIEDHLPRGRLRMARAGLLDVSGDERRSVEAGRALRLDLEPQLRRAPGLWRAHAPRQPGDGRGGRRQRPSRRCARVHEVRSR